MDFRILGPLQVVGDDGPLRLGGPKQHAVLAHLILRPNRIVPAGLLIDELWGDGPPETAKNTLQTYVYRLRKVLGDTRIEAGSGGYLLRAEPDESDAGRFGALVKLARGGPRGHQRGAIAPWRDRSPGRAPPGRDRAPHHDRARDGEPHHGGLGA